MDTFNCFSELAAANQDNTCDSSLFITNMPQGQREFKTLELGKEYVFSSHPAANGRCDIAVTDPADPQRPKFLSDKCSITSVDALEFRDTYSKFKKWKFTF